MAAERRSAPGIGAARRRELALEVEAVAEIRQRVVRLAGQELGVDQMENDGAEVLAAAHPPLLKHGPREVPELEPREVHDAGQELLAADVGPAARHPLRGVL